PEPRPPGAELHLAGARRRAADGLRRRLADAELLLRLRPGRGHGPPAPLRLHRAGQLRKPAGGDDPRVRPDDHPAVRKQEPDRLPAPARGRPEGPPARHRAGPEAPRLGAARRPRGGAPADHRVLRREAPPAGMKVLVTGGAGFIGSHVVDACVAAGHDVIVIDDLSTGRRENLNPRARFHQLDIGDRRTAELIRDEKPEVLSHHAAQMDVRRSVADPLFDARVNVLGTIHLLEAARQAGVQRVLFVSSGGAVYGEQEAFPAPETHPTNPVSPYGVSKRAGGGDRRQHAGEPAPRGGGQPLGGAPRAGQVRRAAAERHRLPPRSGSARLAAGRPARRRARANRRVVPRGHRAGLALTPSLAERDRQPYSPWTWTPLESATSPSSRTSTTASRRSPTACSSRP